MIVRPTADGFLVITQADHARFAADFLSLVRLPELIEHPRREELLRAVAEHDNGWWEADAAPRWDPETGAPLDFRRMPPDVRREIWTRGVERYAQESPGIASRIATHALRLFATFRNDSAGAEVTDFISPLERRRDELREAADLSPEQLVTDDTWLRLADEVSLAACTGDSTLVTTPGWRAEGSGQPDANEVLLVPFPFAGPTRLPLRVRHLSTALAVSVAAARVLASPRWEIQFTRIGGS